MWPRKSSKQPSDAPSEAPVEKPVAARAAAPLYQKPRADLYTVLLTIALLALLVGILYLCLEMSQFGFNLKGAPAVTLRMAQQPMFASWFPLTSVF